MDKTLEEVLDDIERKFGRTIARDKILPREDCVMYDIPVYWHNRGDGTHIELAELEGQLYRVKPLSRANSHKPTPVDILRSGRH